jgi:23S rRNA (uracil1939-C5)-methyltransferase
VTVARAGAAPRALELRIDSIAAGGDGVGRADRLVVFVPRSAPGDVGVVRATVRGRFARGKWESLRTPSPDRVEPPCRHYTADRCGGCQLQHLAYGAQLEAKAGIVHDALTRIGRRPVDSPEVRASPAQWRYREKLTLSLRRRGGRWLAGLHPYDDASAVFRLRDCPITDERVLPAWREVLAAARLLPPPPVSELRGAVRLGDEGGATFVLEGGASWEGAERFFAAVPSLDALWWRPGSPHGAGRGRRRLVAERRRGAPGAAFAQVNRGVAAALRHYAVERVLARRPASVIDAYAGTGATAGALAAAGVRVTAIELDADAARWAATSLPPPSRVLVAAVEDVLASALPADVVLANPPRAGLHASVSDALQRAAPAPRAVVYVSCNPATLARDLARLERYRLESVVAFDMFPQTAHVETVCELVPA